MGKRIWMLLPLSLLFLLSQFYRTSSAVIASELMHDLSLTAANLGALSSVFFYAFALIQIPMGAVIDRFSLPQGQLSTEAFSFAFCFVAAVLGSVAYLFVKEARS